MSDGTTDGHVVVIADTHRAALAYGITDAFLCSLGREFRLAGLHGRVEVHLEHRLLRVPLVRDTVMNMASHPQSSVTLWCEEGAFAPLGPFREVWRPEVRTAMESVLTQFITSQCIQSRLE